MTPIALQLGGSLIAILLLSWLVRIMGLGGDVRLRSEVEVRELARVANSTFEPVDIAIDRAGIGAHDKNDFRRNRDAIGRQQTRKRQGRAAHRRT